MAIDKVIKIDVDELKAMGGLDSLKKSLDNSSESTKNLKQQLREATLELQDAQSQYGSYSQKALDAAKKVAILKDSIQDAKETAALFDPGAKFAAAQGVIGAATSAMSAYQGATALLGVESKAAEEVLVQLNATMAMTQGINGLIDSQKHFSRMKSVAIDTFKGIKSAIGSTGIGLLVIALGAVYAYWDDIKAAVSGVNEQQKISVSLANEKAEASKKELSTLNAQDNVLKLQGKSEKEILALKIKKYDVAIKDAKAALAAQKQLSDAQIAGTERNYKLAVKVTQAIADSVLMTLRVLTEPIQLLIDGANYVAKALGKEGFNIDLNKKLSGYGKDFADWSARLMFDPEAAKAEAAKTYQAGVDEINKLTNEQAGLQLQQQGKPTTTKTKTEKKKEVKIEASPELERERMMYKFRTEMREKFNDGLAELDKQRAEDEAFLEEARLLEIADREKKKQDLEEATYHHKIALLNASADALSAASQLAGEQSAAGKAFAIASTIISTYAAAQKAYESAFSPMATVFSPALGAVSAGVAIATGLANVKKIMSVQVPGGGGSTPSVPAGASTIPTPTFNIAGDTGTNQIAKMMGTQQPVKAYVVAKEVSTQQSLDRNIIRNASLG